MSKVYGYCRTARAGNMEEQIELVSNYCKAKGLDLTICFCDDGVSAHNLSREELDKLFDVLENGDVVVTKDPSRFARDPQKQQLLINKMYDVGVEIVYVDEKEEDDEIGIKTWVKQRWAKQTIYNHRKETMMKVAKGYKLFEMRDDGKLFPLFIGKNEETVMNEWVMAEIIMDHKGFAHRPGWHIGAEMPSAPWLMSADGTYKSQRGKRFRRVWCEVEYVANVDYTEEVLRQPKKCFTDRLPDGGFYNFRESGNRLWIIADRIKVTKVISEAERMEILSQMNYDEQEAFEPYRQAMAKRMKVS